VVFAAASLTCGLSGSTGLLIAARGVQGLGAAAMFATTMALISSSYSGRDRGIAFGIWAAINGAASAAGPLAGGLLATHFGWRWIFLVNLPVSVVAFALTLLVVRESRNPGPRRIDLPGMASFTVAASALTYALIRGYWGSDVTIGLLVIAAAALVVFVVVERLRRDPMLDLSLLRNPTFATLLAAVALLPAAAWGPGWCWRRCPLPPWRRCPGHARAWRPTRSTLSVSSATRSGSPCSVRSSAAGWSAPRARAWPARSAAATRAR
jgi:MFS family permease